jgi:hypothetical protein
MTMIHRMSESQAKSDAYLQEFFSHLDEAPGVIRQSAKFFEFFAQTIYPLLEAHRSKLEALYSPDQGRPSEDPILLLGVLVLQFMQRLPDIQAAEAVQYDLRWRKALHLGAGEAVFHPSLLSVFRERLLKGGVERVSFEAVLDRLVADGWVRRRSKQRLDSTHVCGLLSHMSRLECARETIRLALEALDDLEGLPQVWLQWWERYVESRVDPRAGVDTLKAHVIEAGHDMQGLLAWADRQSEPVRNHAQIQLVRRVFQENYEVDETGALRQRRAQPTGAVHNPHEPQAQWSCKSTTKDKSWVGTKVQVAETVQDEPRAPGEPTCNFITAMVTQDAPESDKAGMAQVLAEQQQMGLEAPSALYTDGAYVSAQALHEAKEEGRELRGPAPASPDHGKVFTVESFDVQVSERMAICPVGKRSTNWSRLEEASTGKVNYRIEWNQSLCGNCPLHQQCLGERQKHRTIVVGEHHDLLQARRREMQTETFELEMHRRNGIEGTQSELVRAFGLRRARYRGKAKVRLQNYFIGTACNIRRWFRRLTWEIQAGLQKSALVA